jgi:iron(III) transport system ATP-binding protein
MHVLKALELMQKYNNCPSCGSGSDKIGNGAGDLVIDGETFTRTCKCGFKVTLDEDGDEIENVNLKWSCNECGYVWYDDVFTTHIECPECESEYIGHH